MIMRFTSKKLILLSLAVMSLFIKVQAQWSTVSTTNMATSSTYTGNVGIGTGTTTPAAAKLEIATSGNGANILKFTTERPWVFYQDGTGSGAELTLKDLTGSKSFKIKDFDGTTNFSVNPVSSYFRSPLGIGAAPATGVMFDIFGSTGGSDNRNFRVTYPGGNGLLNTELAGLANLQTELSVGWTALYTRQGAATYAGVFNGKTIFINGAVGIGTKTPYANAKLHISGGDIVFEALGGAQPTIYMSTGSSEAGKYLSLINSTTTGYTSASGLKAGGILVADAYNYANPGKNDVVVKGTMAIGTNDPQAKLHVSGGHMILDVPNSNPTIFTGTGTTDLNKYLTLINSPDANAGYASGLKAGGILISDSYAYANPGKNDLIVKGNVGIGTPTPSNKLTVYNASADADLGILTNLNTASASLEFRNAATARDGALIYHSDGRLSINLDNSTAANVETNEYVTILNTGDVGIGTTDTKGNKLGVNGTIIANEITVKVYPWSDYVFADDYKLPSLSETEKYIKENKHLPEVPSAAEVETNGVKVGEMEAILLKKIEELTLYVIELKKENQKLKQCDDKIDALEKKIATLETSSLNHK
jgi:hypothetical protein